ncbi:helix-turn-helix transcriptional regulator [Clostridioides difficile]|nr:helix-turn-helix transcriptional regulator [Clostridioides difficile]
MINPVDSYKKLEVLVNAEGISFYALAKELGFPSSFFSEWKRGKMMPKADKLMPLAKRFEVPIEYFIE